MQQPAGALVSQPQYRASPKPKVFWASFPLAPSAPTLSVEIKRALRYPGLASEAADTRAIYAGAAELLRSAAGVLDIGCGSGLGTGVLAAHFERVCAIDVASDALEFAREYLAPSRGVEVRRAADWGVSGPGARHEAGCLIDVLGHAASPPMLLRNARRWLSDGARLFIAEPLASPTQSLLPPVLRAFSRRGLAQLLARSGWEVESWVDTIGQFVSCVARPSPESGWLDLERADLAREQGDWAAALEAYGRAGNGAAAELECEALLGAAEVRAALGDLDEVCRCLLEAARVAPNNARALAGLAELSLLSGDARQALELAVRALEQDPCDVVAMQALARGAQKLEQADAFASWRIANALAPADIETAIELSRLAAARGQLGYAIWVLERVRAFRDDLVADFHVTLGWLYVSHGRLGEARLEAELARVKEPGSSAVRELWAELAAAISASGRAPHLGHAAE
jgi:tetratricopeptide (TPR) repeat protein